MAWENANGQHSRATIEKLRKRREKAVRETEIALREIAMELKVDYDLLISRVKPIALAEIRKEAFKLAMQNGCRIAYIAEITGRHRVQIERRIYGRPKEQKERFAYLHALRKTTDRGPSRTERKKALEAREIAILPEPFLSYYWSYRTQNKGGKKFQHKYAFRMALEDKVKHEREKSHGEKSPADIGNGTDGYGSRPRAPGSETARNAGSGPNLIQ